MRLKDLPEETNEASGQVLDAAIEVHRALGPGLLESTYKEALAHELRLRRLTVDLEVPLAIQYKTLHLPNAYRADMVVAARVVVELKCVESITREHEAQLLTYLRASGCRLGILLNFHAARMRDGYKRMVL